MTSKKKRFSPYKLANKALLYIIITSVAFTILLPVFFLVSLSFLTTRDSYKFPLPLLPSLTSDYKLEHGERGYLLSIYDKAEEDYETIMDTKDLEKMSIFMKTRLGTPTTIEEVEEQVARLETADIVYFTKKVDLLHNFKAFFLITNDAFPALLRSLQICVLTILISLSIGGMAGYAFARYSFAGRDALKFSVLFVRMFPGIAIALPMVVILIRIGFYDNPIGLALVYSIGSIALTVWITASIFMGIPVTLEEAAQVFGATKVQTFMRITFPLALPGLAAAAMYAFLGAWNETVAAIVLTQFNPTFSVVVYQSLVGAVGQVNLAAAGGIVMAVPTVIFTFIIRRYINQMWGGMSV
jgi:multiple sugar transport system permease protein